MAKIVKACGLAAVVIVFIVALPAFGKEKQNPEFPEIGSLLAEDERSRDLSMMQFGRARKRFEAELIRIVDAETPETEISKSGSLSCALSGALRHNTKAVFLFLEEQISKEKDENRLKNLRAARDRFAAIKDRREDKPGDK